MAYNVPIDHQLGVMVSQPLKAILPSTEELPCSDDTPVDNEDQNLLPNLLLFALTLLWAERMDWFFGVDMAIYHTTGVNPRVPVVPDAFLSLGVERRKGGRSRRSYATWEENDTAPILVLEMVSHRPNDEYDDKLELYARLGVLYYVVYNPEFWQRDRHQPFEVYKLEGETYRLQMGEPYWMPEVGLGIGRGRQIMGGIEQEVLLWYDAQSKAYPLPDEVMRQMQLQLKAERQRAEQERQRAEAEQQRAAAERQRAEQERQRAEQERQRAEQEQQRAEQEQQRAEQAEEKANRLAQRLRELGIDPEQA